MRTLTLIVSVVLTCYILMVILFFNDNRAEGECEGIHIAILDSLDKRFVNDKEIQGFLKGTNINPNGKDMSSVNTEAIEQSLQKNPMLREVEVYKTPSGKVRVDVIQKIPIMRIMGTHGNFYLDKDGDVMPTSSRFAAHVPVVTGYVEKEFAKQQLYDFAKFLQDDRFWRSQIEQIYVDQNLDVELIPRVGSHRIILGSLDHYHEKLNNLMLFYRQAVPYVGWNRYSTINLKFKNQIVCTKRK